MNDTAAPPRPIGLAGVLVGAQGAIGILVAALMLVADLRGTFGYELTLATAAWFAGFGAILIAVGVNLHRGRHGARSPAIVAQLLLLGAAWYAAGPSGRPLYGVLAAVFCVVVLGLLFAPASVRWASGEPTPPDNGRR